MTDLKPWDLPNLVGEAIAISFSLKDMATMDELLPYMKGELGDANYRQRVRKLDEEDCLWFIQEFGKKVAKFLKEHPDFKERFSGCEVGGTIPNAYKYPATATVITIYPKGQTHYRIEIERRIINSYDGSYIRADIMGIPDLKGRRAIRKKLGLSAHSIYVELY